MACCVSSRFAEEMAASAPFSGVEEAIAAARDIWFNKVDVVGWLEAFAAHPQIGRSPSPSHMNDTSAEWSKGEQSTAIATATDSSLQELFDWNARYRQKFGFVFLICASGRTTPEILSELKKRYLNRPIVEFDIAAREQMKITEIRLAKLFESEIEVKKASSLHPEIISIRAEEDRVSKIVAHVTPASGATAGKTAQIPTRTRPPITTHVLDVARGLPAAGIEVILEMWKGNQTRPLFGQIDTVGWEIQGSSITNEDGRSSQLMDIVDFVKPGIYRISFNTSHYCPTGFFPHVSIVFEIREFQKLEHFHVPLLLSPFSFSTYRGS